MTDWGVEPMTVGELIDKLKEVPKDYKVWRMDASYGWVPLTEITVNSANPRLESNRQYVVSLL
jgi:hypothetical protein